MRTSYEVIDALRKRGDHKCEHCGANISSIEHSLSLGLVNSLRKFATAIKKKKINEAHLQKECGLSFTEHNNFQKLGYFGLVAKKKGKSGYWVLTRNGGAFLRNELAIPKNVRTFRDFKIDESEKTVKIRDFYNDVYTDDYWQTTFEMRIEQGKLL